ncbi:tyrosine-type recombinase/integrase [Anaeromicropila populeti]|uniref:Site-specific recombinase XerD n=1 Tax=Anaeromicropila populeti TaxID=37658 RepID=A0A1I6L190_9FIRM|nr:tyrosine-type recombinase/integrase [Anaeromicropila populeti]SFR97217.1 Site-specific recombinase XerD [Anaeromicropila populeti]
MDNLTYHQQKYIENTKKLRSILETLPSFTKDYFRAIEPTTSTKTRISYAYDLRVFFFFLRESNSYFRNKETSQIKLSDLDLLQPTDIEEYLEFLKVYEGLDGKIQKNDERGIHRKFSSLRSFYLYYSKRRMIQNNPTVVLDMPKLHQREIIRLDYDEVAELLDLVEFGGENLTGMKKIYFEKNKVRNLAIFTLLLGTGIRVSECVGLDINDIDFKNNRIKVIRKGGKEDYVYFGEEVENALQNYLEVSRSLIHPVTGHENALFLSIQKKRMTVKAIENLVSEHAKQITSFKHITPHKLRSTYGTNLYRETGDIYLVAEVLGHNDVNTTRKHYAALDEDRKRLAAKAVKLRE